MHHVLCVRFIASNWVWLNEPMLGHWGVGPGRSNRWACSGFGVTFESRQVGVGAFKGEAIPVNEALYAGMDLVMYRDATKT